jgi:signal transduction histidine kinase
MRRRFPFALRLGFSFAGVVLLCVALIYFLTAHAITARFAEFRNQSKEQVARQVCGLLAEYHLRTDSWLGIERLLCSQYAVFLNGRWIVRRTSVIGDFCIAGEDGEIVVTTQEGRLGTFLTPKEAAEGIPIQQGDERVGTLFLCGQGPVLDPAEAEFLGSAKRSALIGGGIASGAALVLAALLISQVLSPLRLLSRATERIARGDLTHRVRLKAEDEFGQLGESFDRMVDNLSRSEQIRQTMTADIAHELRTPVTIIQGNLEAVLDGVYQPTAEALAPIYEETLHLGRLIDDLRDLALAEAGELRLEKEPTDLGALANQVMETVRLSQQEKGPRIEVTVACDLPKVSLDPKRIRQVLANFLSNALRYTPDEGEIRLDLARQGEEVEVRVTDSGPGISPEDLPHLFQRFYRGDEARSRAVGGSGLGLAIAKQWVGAHGGRIWAENKKEGGASFVFRLPIA